MDGRFGLYDLGIQMKVRNTTQQALPINHQAISACLRLHPNGTACEGRQTYNQAGRRCIVGVATRRGHDIHIECHRTKVKGGNKMLQEAIDCLHCQRKQVCCLAQPNDASMPEHTTCEGGATFESRGASLREQRVKMAQISLSRCLGARKELVGKKLSGMHPGRER